MTAARSLLARLHALLDEHAPPRRLLVAFSGGRDSTVLLHALATADDAPPLPLRAVHVNHGLQAQADAWETHCATVAARYGVPCDCRRVTVPRTAAGGEEAAARAARYEALAAAMQPGDWLLTAHHAGDQAETLLLNLMRGSGIAGLAAIGAWQPFGPGHRARPLLATPPELVARYAAAQGLEWIEDPSNAARERDRNFLRHDVLPLLAARWPAAVTNIARSAALVAESRVLLDAQAHRDLVAAGTPQRLSLDVLGAWPAPRQRSVVRAAARAAGLPPPPARQLARILGELLPARADGAPCVTWRGGEARRYRRQLYLLAGSAASPRTPGDLLTPGVRLALGGGLGELTLEARDAGIDAAIARDGLRIAYRQGGETIRPHGHECTHRLKKLLQQHAVVPWMRARVPLLYSGDRLVAVADRWIAAECHAARGYTVVWRGHAALD